MASFNSVTLLGNTTREIDLKYTQSGMAVCEVGLAVNDKRKNQAGEWVDDVCFVDITLFGRQAEVASEYLSKGAPVLINGKLKLDQWEKDGQKRSKLRVVGDKIVLLGSKGDKQNTPPAQSSHRDAPPRHDDAPPPSEPDNLPF